MKMPKFETQEQVEREINIARKAKARALAECALQDGFILALQRLCVHPSSVENKFGRTCEACGDRV